MYCCTPISRITLVTLTYMKKFLFITAIALSLSNCTTKESEKEILVESFPIEETLPSLRIDLEDAEYLTDMMGIAGDFLVFRTSRTNYFLQVYDKEFNLVGKLLNQGQGPNELPEIDWYDQWCGLPSNPQIQVVCTPLKRLSSLEINPFNGLTTICDIPASEDLEPRMMFATTDTTILGVSLSLYNGSAIFRYNTENKTALLCESPFEFADGPTKFYTTQQGIAYNPERKEICSAYYSFPSMVIYDYNFNVRRIINIGEKVDTKTLTFDANYPRLTPPQYYKNFIICLLINNDATESKLLVFDTNGEPRASYAVGQAYSFVINEQKQQILTLKYDNEADLVYLDCYPLPELLKH